MQLAQDDQVRVKGLEETQGGVIALVTEVKTLGGCVPVNYVTRLTEHIAGLGAGQVPQHAVTPSDDETSCGETLPRTADAR